MVGIGKAYEPLNATVKLNLNETRSKFNHRTAFVYNWTETSFNQIRKPAISLYYSSAVETKQEHRYEK